MPESEARSDAATGRYAVEPVSGEMGQKSHRQSARAGLDGGSARGWRPVSAATTNASGAWVTAVYWDTAPSR